MIRADICQLLAKTSCLPLVLRVPLQEGTEAARNAGKRGGALQVRQATILPLPVNTSALIFDEDSPDVLICWLCDPRNAWSWALSPHAIKARTTKQSLELLEFAANLDNTL